jgi:tRNA(Ile)-lysidine synthase
MFEEFLSYIRRNNLFKRKDRLLLAVSGGIDSMVMSHLFIKLGTDIGIAHCNFCLREKESDKDEELVKEFAHENKIPFYSVRFNTKEYAAKNGISIQMAARDLRYEWFEKIRLENNFDLVAVAHNLNDNIETMLINLTRGTGLTGLSGMRPANNRIIRPLLFASRKKIEEYCSDKHITFREDESNAETKYTRNKIRHLVIPVLKEINPSFEETLNETAEKLSGIDEIVTGYIDGIRSQTSIRKGTATVYDVEKLINHLKSKALVFELFSPYGVKGSATGDLIRLLNGKTGKQIFTKTHRILRNRDELIVSPLVNQRQEHYEIDSVEDLLKVPGIKSAGIIDAGAGLRIPRKKSIASIDSAKIKFPLIIRRWKRGDFFYPLGMKQKKKLSDYFIDRKYSLVRKENVLILESEGKIVWIIGERIDERCKVTESTSKILRIELNNDLIDKEEQS